MNTGGNANALEVMLRLLKLEQSVDPDDPFAAPKKDLVKYNRVKTISRMRMIQLHIVVFSRMRLISIWGVSRSSPTELTGHGVCWWRV